MGLCPLDINPYPQPFLVGSVTVSGGGSFPLRWAFYSVLSRFYLVVWLELQPPGCPCSSSFFHAFHVSFYGQTSFTQLEQIIFQCEQIHFSFSFVVLQKSPQTCSLFDSYVILCRVQKKKHACPKVYLIRPNKHRETSYQIAKGRKCCPQKVTPVKTEGPVTKDIQHLWIA